MARLDATNPDLAAVFYVDGHVRAYRGTRKVAKTHIARLKFPAPATVETWVSDAAGDPVLVDMAQPGTSLTVWLDPLPTKRATTAIAELCEHLTATQTHYPGTDLLLRYEVKTQL